jgi:hypothetical protein
VAEIGEKLVTGQQAEEEGEELGGRGMFDCLLGHGNSGQLLREADLVGEMAPGDKQDVLGGAARKRGRSRG